MSLHERQSPFGIASDAAATTGAPAASPTDSMPTSSMPTSNVVPDATPGSETPTPVSGTPSSQTASGDASGTASRSPSCDELDPRSEAPTLLGAAWPAGWRTLAVLTLWCAAVVGVFTAMGELVERSPIDDADRRFARDAVERRTDALDAWAPWAAGLSDTLVKIIATTLVVGAMFWVWRRWLEPLIVAGALIFEASAFMLSTLLVSRPRPDVERLQESPVNSSWPSGHVAAATAYAAIAVVVSRHLRATAAKVAVWAMVAVITVVVAAARIYQGMHFASDVVAGVLLGATSVAIVTVVLDRAAARRSIDPAPID